MGIIDKDAASLQEMPDKMYNGRGRFEKWIIVNETLECEEPC